ncbi:hypothetical protein SAMN04487989_106154 [Bizionia echini]|uniref:Uncharacterized protein n=1 Tax=Bizionia echini TaxID=649333 RepID=A0A1I5D1G8_9FLAO|nr:hypothetical protein [Bizionia echini]SFN92993.1 hypothetical protein SAMN04487989_106154 [Bizionia echini]
MTRKILTLVLLITFFNIGFGQNKSCTENFLISSKTINIPNSNLPEQLISWNFTKATNKDSLILELEIQPLNSCWNGLNGTKRSESIIHKINNLNQNSKGELAVSFKELNAKCFKWRTKIVDTLTNCKSYTEWQFFSFL